MTLAPDPAGRHRQVAAGFGVVVHGVGDWGAPTPVAEWVARDVVEHLLTWFAGFLQAGTGIVLDPGPPVDVDPAAAWVARSAEIQALLETPEPGWLRHPQVGELPLPAAIDRFYTADVFMHTWDLAAASGQDHGLDTAYAAEMLAGMEPLDAVLRSSGHYGPAVPAPPGADPVIRLMAFVGRDPSWRPPTP